MVNLNGEFRVRSEIRIIIFWIYIAYQVPFATNLAHAYAILIRKKKTISSIVFSVVFTITDHLKLDSKILSDFRESKRMYLPHWNCKLQLLLSRNQFPEESNLPHCNTFVIDFHGIRSRFAKITRTDSESLKRNRSTVRLSNRYGIAQTFLRYTFEIYLWKKIWKKINGIGEKV